MRGVWRGLGRLSIAAAGLLIALEMTLRWGVGLGDPPLARLDPATEYELAPSAEYSRWGNRIAINSRGTRGPEFTPLPGAGERRILLVGDSVIYGNHFLDQEETIAARMRTAVSEDPDLAGCDVMIVAAAVASWGPVNQAAFLAREGVFGAHAAFLVVSAHDLYDLPQSRPDILPYRLRPPRTAIGDALEAALERRARGDGEPDPRPLERRMQESLAALGRMATQMRAEGVEPTLVYHPTVPERRGQTRREKAIFAIWAQERSIRFFDLEAAIPSATGYRDEIHPDPEGAAAIAQTLAGLATDDLAPCAAAPSGASAPAD